MVARVDVLLCCPQRIVSGTLHRMHGLKCGSIMPAVGSLLARKSELPRGQVETARGAKPVADMEKMADTERLERSGGHFPLPHDTTNYHQR